MPEFANAAPADIPAVQTGGVIQTAQPPVKEDLEIVDPSVPRPTDAPPSFRPQEAPKPLPGATADSGYTPEMLQRAAAAGIPEADAKRTPISVLSRVLSQPSASAPAESVPTPQELQYYRSQGYLWNGFGYEPIPQAAPPQPGQAAASPFDKLRQYRTEDGQGNQIGLPDVLVDSIQELHNASQRQLQQQAQIIQQQQQQFQRMQADADRRESARLTQQLTDSMKADTVYADAYALDREAAGKLGDAMNAIMQAAPHLSHDERYALARNTLFGMRAAPPVQPGERARNADGTFAARPTATTRTAASDIDQMPYGEDRARRRLDEALQFQSRN